MSFSDFAVQIERRHSSTLNSLGMPSHPTALTSVLHTFEWCAIRSLWMLTNTVHGILKRALRSARVFVGWGPTNLKIHGLTSRFVCKAPSPFPRHPPPQLDTTSGMLCTPASAPSVIYFSATTIACTVLIGRARLAWRKRSIPHFIAVLETTVTQPICTHVPVQLFVQI